jgi:hypothetical protein
MNFETDKLLASEDSNRSPKRSVVRRRETKSWAAETDASIRKPLTMSGAA